MIGSGNSWRRSWPTPPRRKVTHTHTRALRSEHVSTHKLKATSSCSPAAPTNIYIQGLDSVGQLSTEIRYLKEEKESLLEQLEQLEQACRGRW